MVTNTAGEIVMSRVNEAAKVTVNGEPLVDGYRLQHMDRLIFGNNHVYLVRGTAGGGLGRECVYLAAHLVALRGHAHKE